MITFNQYDVVRLIQFLRPIDGFKVDGFFNNREPAVGDIATIVEVYDDPPGYDLECCASNDGITTWLHTFAPDSVKLELVWRE